MSTVHMLLSAFSTTLGKTYQRSNSHFGEVKRKQVFYAQLFSTKFRFH